MFKPNDNLTSDQLDKKLEAVKVEEKINHIAGVVANGIFSIRHADVVLIGTADGIKTIKPN